MQVLNLENEWTLLTALETHLLEGVKGPCPDRFWRECRNGLRSLFHPEQLQEIGGRFFGIHADFSQRQVQLLDDCFGALGLADATVMAEHVDQGMIRNIVAVGETAPFEIGDSLVL